MLRKLMSLAVVLALSTGAQASLHTFNPGTNVTSSPFTLVGSGVFDESPLLTGGVYEQFLIQPSMTFGATVIGDTVGPVTFTATKVVTGPSNVTIELRDAANPGYGAMEIIFQPTGFTPSGTVPETSGLALWRVLGLNDPSSPTNYLQGVLDSASISAAAVPEPSAFALGGLVAGVVGVGRFFRRRKSTEPVAA